MCCEQGMRMPVFNALTLKQGIVYNFTTSVFWTEILYRPEATNEKSLSMAMSRAKWVVPSILILKKFLSHDLSLKNSQFCLRNGMNQSLEIGSFVLNKEAKWTIFVLREVRVWRVRQHTNTQTSFECPPRLIFQQPSLNNRFMKGQARNVW